MNRRNFLSAIAAAAGVGRYNKKVMPPPPYRPPASLMLPPLRFHRDAFTLVYPKVGDTLHVRVPLRFHG